MASLGAIALVATGGLFIHAALTKQSPLADLQSIMSTGKVGTVATAPTPSASASASALNSGAGVPGTTPNLGASLNSLNSTFPGTVIVTPRGQ